MKNTRKSRHGLHKENSVILGGLVPPRLKAITIVTAAAYAGNGEKINQLDLIWEGVKCLAQKCGVLDTNGNVTAKFKDSVTLCEAMLVEKLNQKRSLHK